MVMAPSPAHTPVREAGELSSRRSQAAEDGTPPQPPPDEDAGLDWPIVVCDGS